MTRLIQHECRLLWRTGVWAACSLGLVAWLGVAAWTSAARTAGDAAARRAYTALVADEWRTQPSRHPHRVAHYGFLVFRPIGPLTVLEPGVLPFTGSTLFLEAHRANLANFSDAAASHGLLRFGDLSPALVLQLFLPLVLIATVAWAVARERETGTRALVLAQGVAPWRVLVAKIAAVNAMTATALVPGLGVVWAAILAVGHDFPWPPDTSARLLAWTAIHLVYLATVSALATVIAWHCRTARSALVVLISAWMASSVVVPRVLPAVVEAWMPTPSRSAFEAEVAAYARSLGDSHDPDDPAFAAFRRDTLARYGVDRIEDLPVNYAGLVSAFGEELTTRANQTFRDGLNDRYTAQERLASWASLASPYLAVRRASLLTAGVDLDHANDFDRQAEAYRYALIQYLNGLHAHEIASDRDRYIAGATDIPVPSRQRLSGDRFQAAPTFSFEPATIAEATRQRPIVYLAVLGWALVAVGTVAWWRERHR